MALGGTYSTGTVDVTNGQKAVTGNGVLWTDVEEGDWLVVGTAVAIIDSVDSGYASLQLKDNWAGSTASATAYRILKMSWLRYDPSLTQAKLRQFIVDIEAAGIFLFVSGSSPDPSLGEDGQWALKVNASPWTLWYKDTGSWVQQNSPAGAPSGGDRYDIAVWSSDRPPAGSTIVQVVVPTAVTFYANLSDSKGHAATGATGSPVFNLQKNGSTFGTVTFSGMTATFAAASDAVFSAGDIFGVVSPSPVDATLAGIAFTVAGFR